MIFYYSYRQLFSIFIFRLIPSLLFLYIALWIGEVFWFVTILLWLEAVVEVILRNRKGYCKITEQEFLELGILFSKRMNLADIKQIYSYDGEWVFRNVEHEIRIKRNHIRKSQLIFFDEKISEITSHIKLSSLSDS